MAGAGASPRVQGGWNGAMKRGCEGFGGAGTTVERSGLAFLRSQRCGGLGRWSGMQHLLLLKRSLRGTLISRGAHCQPTVMVTTSRYPATLASAVHACFCGDLGSWVSF